MEPPAGDPLMLQYRTPKEFLDCRQSVATLLSEAHVSPAQPSHAKPPPSLSRSARAVGFILLEAVLHCMQLHSLVSSRLCAYGIVHALAASALAPDLCATRNDPGRCGIGR
jgi:hypothetical protein